LLPFSQSTCYERIKQIWLYKSLLTLASYSHSHSLQTEVEKSIYDDIIIINNIILLSWSTVSFGMCRYRHIV